MEINAIGIKDRLFAGGTNASETIQENDKKVFVQTTEGIDEVKEKKTASHLNMDKTAEGVGLYEGEPPKEDEISVMVEQIKAQLTKLANQMTGKDYEELKAMGYDPKKDETGKIETVMDQIQVKLAVFCDNYYAGINIDRKDLEAILGNSALASSVAQKLSDYDMPVTEDNLKKAIDCVKRAHSLSPVTREHASYLIEQNMEPTYENIYKAQHSTGVSNKVPNPLTDKEWNAISDQAAGMLKKAGVNVTKDSLEDARWMIEQGMDLVPENIQAMQAYQDIDLGERDDLVDQVVRGMALGRAAGPEDITYDPNIAENAVWKVNERIDQALTDLDKEVESDRNEKGTEIIKEQTDFNSSQTGQKKQTEGEDANSKNQGQREFASDGDVQIEIKQLTSRRKLEELRLMMTKEAAIELIDKGIDIDTEPLESLVNILSQQEREYYRNIYQAEGFEVTEEKLDRLQQITHETKAIKDIPVYIEGELLNAQERRDISLTLHETYSRGMDLKERMKAAGENYEALMTRPDKEYGDSLTKAFANMDSLLDEMDLEKTEENRRAVRILAYNQMEISEEQVQKIKDLDAEYQYLLKNLTPRAAMHLIEERVSPLDIEIHELNDKLEKLNEQLGASKEERYSEFLWKLEQGGEVSGEVRDAYIGLYRLLNNVSRIDGAALGALVNQGSEVTLENLLSAVRSRKAKGMDVSIDQAYGLAERVFHQNSITDQLKLFYQSEGQETKQQKDSYGQEVIHKMKELSKDTDAIQMLVEKEEQISVNALMAAGVITGKRAGRMRQFWMEQTKKDWSEFTEHMTDRDSMQQIYEDVEESFEKRLDDFVQVESPSYEELEECRLFYRTSSLIRSLSKQEDYQIPMELSDETAMVHVKFVHDGITKGKVSVEMQIEEKGNVMAEFYLNGSELKGNLMADSVKLKGELMDLEAPFKERLESFGITSELTCLSSKELPSVGYKKVESNEESDRVHTRTLYQVAKTFLETIKMGL